MTFVWKGAVVAAIGALIWLAAQDHLPLWATALAISIAAIAVFRFAPPRPVSTPRRDAAVALGTMAAAVVVGLIAERL